MSEAKEFQVQAKALRLANAFTSDDPGRIALQHVHFKGDTLEASDGHIGVTVKVAVEGPEGESLLVPGDTLNVIKAKDVAARISLNGDARLILGQSETVFQPGEGAFPNMSQVYPTQEPVATISINPRLAARMFKALAEYLKDEYQPTVTLSLYGPEKAIRIQAGAGDHVDALLMPCRRK